MKASQKPVLTKKHPNLAKVCNKYCTIKLPKPCGVMCYGLMKPEFNFLAIIHNNGKKKTLFPR